MRLYVVYLFCLIAGMAFGRFALGGTIEPRVFVALLISFTAGYFSCYETKKK